MFELFNGFHEVLKLYEKYIHIHSFPFRRIFHPNLGTPVTSVNTSLVYWSRWGRQQCWREWKENLRQMLEQRLLESQAERCREKRGTWRNVRRGKFLQNMSKRYPATALETGSTFRSTVKSTLSPLLREEMWCVLLATSTYTSSLHCKSEWLTIIIVFHTQNAFVKTQL